MVSCPGPLDGLRAAACLWAFTAVAASTSTASAIARKYPRNSMAVAEAAPDAPIVYGESAASRTFYTIVSLVCVSLLTGMLGYRARQLERCHLRSLSLTHVLVLILYVLAISFVTSAVVVESGDGLSSPSTCHAAVIICLAFYVGSKVTMYIFLVERAHALRAPYMRRSRDWIWLTGMLTIGCGFGSIAICGFVWPIADLSQIDGRCRIGLPYKVTIPLLSFDIIINTLLTGIFIYLLRPLFRLGGMPNDDAVAANMFTKGMRRILTTSRRSDSVDFSPMNGFSSKSIEALLWKSLIGSVLVMLPTVGNLAALLPLRGRELGGLCLTICTFDVTWAVCVIHWLTIRSTEIDERALALLVPQPESASNASAGPAQSSV